MTRLIVLVGFLFAFGAGLMIGLNRPQVATPGAPDEDQPRDRGSWLAQQLQLTPEQQEQMKAIWSEAAKRGRSHQFDQRRQLREQRDAAVEKLISAENRAAYDKIQDDYEQQVRANETEWRQSFQRSVERTKEILTPEQREKYEAILSKQFGDGSSGRGPRPSTSPSSLPSWPSQPSPATSTDQPVANPTH